MEESEKIPLRFFFRNDSYPGNFRHWSKSSGRTRKDDFKVLLTMLAIMLTSTMSLNIVEESEKMSLCFC